MPKKKSSTPAAKKAEVESTSNDFEEKKAKKEDADGNYEYGGDYEEAEESERGNLSSKEEKESEAVDEDATLEILTDIIEYQIEMIFLDRAKRIQHWQTLEFFYNMYRAKDHPFGRLHAHRRLAEILVDACSAQPYARHENTSYTEDDKNLALVEWTADHWRQLIEDLREARAVCLRRDARTRLPMSDAEKWQDEREDKRRIQLDSFGQKFQVLIGCTEIQKAVAPIRAKLELQIEVNKEGPADLDESDVKKVIESIETFEDKKKGLIRRLFVGFNDEGAPVKDAPPDMDKLEIKPLEELAVYFSKMPFELGWYQEKLELAVQRWNVATFGKDDVTLLKLKYRISPGSDLFQVIKRPKEARRLPMTTPEPGMSETPAPETAHTEDDGDEPKVKQELVSQADLDELKKGRAALKDHGEDPLEDSRAIAEEATGVPRKRSVEGREEDEGDDENEKPPAKRLKKKTTGQITFMDDLEEDDADDERERIHLSELPAKVKSPIPKTYVGPAPDDGVFDKEGKVVKRRKWSDEEKNAVKEGVKRFGVGKWVDIKSHYGDLLRNRTAVQIKDVWRTMSKNKEVQEDGRAPMESTPATTAVSDVAADSSINLHPAPGTTDLEVEQV